MLVIVVFCLLQAKKWDVIFIKIRPEGGEVSFGEAQF